MPAPMSLYDDAAGTNSNNGTSLDIRSTGDIFFAGRAGGSGRFSVTVTGSYNDGNWHHVVATWDGTTTSGQVKVYVDGAEANTGTSSSTESSAATYNSRIGALASSGSNPFDGTMDEIRLSSVARSADWIEASYRNQKTDSDYVTIGTELLVGDQTTWNQGKFGNALDLDGSGDVLASKVVADGGDPWWDEGYKQRMKLTFDNSASTEDLTDFPTLIRLTQANFAYDNASTTGADIRFVDSNGTTSLAYEIESWNQAATSTIWVKVPQIDAASTSDYIWLYWDNSFASDAQDAEGVWDSDFQGVWHLGEDGNTTSGGYNDSSPTGNDATGVSMTASSDVSGAIGKGQTLDGSTDYIDSNYTLSLGSTDRFTWSGWFKAGDMSSEGTSFVVFGSKDSSNPSDRINFQLEDNTPGCTYTGEFFMSAQDGVAPVVRTCSDEPDTDDDTWHWGAVVFDSNANTKQMFYDGVKVVDTALESTEDDGINLNQDFFIGARNNAGSADQYMEGEVDEIRISDIARSESWMLAQYETQQPSSTFITYGNPSTNMGTDDWTINAWVKTGASTLSVIADKRNASSSKGYALIMNADGTVSSKLGTGSAFVSATSTLTVNDNSWHLVSATYDRSGDMQVYIDGLPSGSAKSISAHSAVNQDTPTSLAFGNKAHPDSTEAAFTGLIDDITIYRRVRTPAEILVNFNESKAVTGATTLGGPASDWMSKDWEQRKKLTLNNASSSENLVDFPLHVQLTTSNFTYSQANATGTDIRFTDSDGITPLPYEIESWNSSATSTIWVKVPRIDAQSTTDHIYMYWGNGTASDGQDAEGVWDSDFQLVQHLEEEGNTDSGGYTDSTSNSLDGTGVSMTGSSDIEGVVGTAQTFDGSADYISLDSHVNSLEGENAGTFEAWIQATASGPLYSISDKDTSNDWTAIWVDSATGSCTAEDISAFVQRGGSSEEYVACGADASVSILDNAWHHVVSVTGNGANTIYINGVAASMTFLSGDATTNEFSNISNQDSAGIARRITSGGTFYHTGGIDELRVSTSARSADWIEASYRSQKTNSDFITHGSSESIDTELRNGWALDGWHNRKKILINNASSTEDLTDFPVPVMLYGNRIDYTKTQDSGEDIRFVDSSGDPLDFEIETWDETATSTLWVRIPTLKAARSDEYIWMYYGNSDVKRSTQDPEGVWDSSYKGVWHLNQDPGSVGSGGMTDSTRNDNDGTDNGSMDSNDTVAGLFGKAVDLDGTNDYIDTSIADMDGPFMVSAWVKTDSASTRQLIVENYDATTKDFFFELEAAGTIRVLADGLGDVQVGSYSADVWTHVVATIDGTTGSSLYQDGVFVASDNSTGSNTDFNSGANYLIGTRPSDTTFNNFNGVIDEVRISTIIRSADYIEASYRAGSDNMLSYGTEESSVDPVLYFDFNDAFASTTATTTQIFDQTSNNNDGQAFGAAWTPNGKFDGAVSFDGVDDIVTVATSSLPTQAISVSAWVKVDTHKSWNRFVTNNWGTDGDWLLYSTSGQWAWGIRGTGAVQKNVVVAHNSDTGWHHLEGTYDGTTQRFYVDGKEVGTPLTHTVTLSQTELQLSETGGTNTLDGLLDEVKVYNYARSAEEVLIDYNAGKSVLLGSGQQFTSTSTVGHWSFDEGAPNDQDPRLLSCYLFNENSGNAIDCTGSGDDGSISGATRVNGVTGESSISTNSALNFDGVNDQVTVTDFGLQDKQKLTYSAWVYVTGGSDTRGIFYEIENGGSSARSQFYISSTDKVNIDVIPADSNGRTNCGNEATDTISTNTWHHVVGQVDLSTEQCWTYVDGVLQATDDDGSTSSSVEDNAPSSAYIGHATAAMEGRVDELRIYDGLLSHAEIQSLYLSGRATDKGSDSTTDLANANHGQLYGPTWRRASQCKIGKCLEFDGTNDYVDIDGYKGPAGSFSFSLWMNPDALSTAIDPVIGNYHTGNDEFYFGPEDDAEFFVRTSGTDGAIDSDAFTTNEWQHVVGVYDEENTEVRLYRNGILLGTGATTGTYDPSSTNDIRIGARASGSSFAYDGLLDDVRMYDYALSQADIMQLYNGGKPIAHYRLDEGAGVRVFDESGEGNHGTTTNMVVDNTNWVNGKFGKALDFDGSDDYVALGARVASTADPLTIAGWIYADDLSAASIVYGMGIARSTTGDNTGDWMFGVDDGGSVHFANWRSSGADVDGLSYTADGVIAEDRWYHVAAQWDGSSNKLYVNGVEVSFTGTESTGSSWGTGHAIGRSWTTTAFHWNGMLDDIRIYNYARSSTEILQDYNNGLAARFGN